MKRPTSPEDVQKVFDCYCKKILKNEAINIQKHPDQMRHQIGKYLVSLRFALVAIEQFHFFVSGLILNN